MISAGGEEKSEGPDCAERDDDGKCRGDERDGGSGDAERPERDQRHDRYGAPFRLAGRMDSGDAKVLDQRRLAGPPQRQRRPRGAPCRQQPLRERAQRVDQLRPAHADHGDRGAAVARGQQRVKRVRGREQTGHARHLSDRRDHLANGCAPCSGIGADCRKTRDDQDQRGRERRIERGGETRLDLRRFGAGHRRSGLQRLIEMQQPRHRDDGRGGPCQQRRPAHPHHPGGQRISRPPRTWMCR